MDIREYAERVKDSILELYDDVSIKVITREVPNGTMTGLAIKESGKIYAPTVYIDDLYEQGAGMGEAVVKVMRRFKYAPDIDFKIEQIKDYEGFIKDRIVARLYNKSMTVEVGMSAKEFGFEDLVIIPYVEIDLGNGQGGSIKVTKELLEQWDVSEDVLMAQALENTKKKALITDAIDYMSRISGLPREFFEGDELDGLMYIVSIEGGQHGAIGAVVLQDELKEKFPNGYTVIPASIHETIIVPNDKGGDFAMLDHMIKEVNATKLAPTDVLSDRHYKIA